MSDNFSIHTTPLKPLFLAYNQVMAGPQNSLRPRQIQFMVTCQEGVENNLPVVIEGPTGLGKTKALLAVAVAYLNTHPGSRVLYTTRTMPQLQNVNEDLMELVGKWKGSNECETPSLLFSAYIGITSIRRLFCQRFLSEITMDKEELEAYREMMDDPERPEPCPDCTIRETRSKYIDADEVRHLGRFGVEDMESSLQQHQCPVPFMRVCAAEASIILTTYPYLFSDFWKATVLGTVEKRKICLPIIDEAHNIIETITENPGLTICLTSQLEPGQGLDLSNNIYYMASLVDDLKYGYKRFVLGHLSRLFNEAMEVQRSSQRTRIDEITILKGQHKQLCEEAKELNSAFHNLRTSLKQLWSGIDPGLESTFPWSNDIKNALTYFSDADKAANKRDSLIKERHRSKDEHRRLCRLNSEKKRERNSLQMEGKRYGAQMRASKGTLRQMYYDLKEDCFNRAQQIHESMQPISNEIDSLGFWIDSLNREIDQINDSQQEAFSQGKIIIDRIFLRIKQEQQSKSSQIDYLNDRIEAIHKEIDEFNNAFHGMDEARHLMFSELDNRGSLEQHLNNFYDSLQIPLEDREKWPAEVHESSFSLYDYLLQFRDVFQELLSHLPSGPLGEAELGALLRQLNERLKIDSGEDIAQFLERCENAVSQFETSMLRSKEHWNGLPLYGLRQMFRFLSLICQGPYGFAGMVDSDGKAPRISFHSLDPAVRFRDAWHDLTPPILASATLSPVSDVADVLGLSHGIRAKIAPVFPIRNYLSFAFLGCHSSPGGPGETDIFNELERKILKENITAILAATRRHTGLFCSSHKVLSAVQDILPRDLFARHSMRLLVARSDGIDPNDDFESLSRKVSPNLLKGMGDFDARLKLYLELAGKVPIVLAGVTGGGLGEGMDFKGEAMELAILIGIPYQDEGDRAWLNDRRTGFFKMRTGELEIGKDLAYRQSALRKVAQTAGRVHRTMRDRGAIVFFDERLLGLKNSGPSGRDRYEVLSAKNTRRHWNIIQTRISEGLKVVIPPSMDRQEAKDLSRYVDRVFRHKNPKPEFTSLDQMLASLRSFFNDR